MASSDPKINREIKIELARYRIDAVNELRTINDLRYNYSCAYLVNGVTILTIDGKENINAKVEFTGGMAVDGNGRSANIKDLQNVIISSKPLEKVFTKDENFDPLDENIKSDFSAPIENYDKAQKVLILVKNRKIDNQNLKWKIKKICDPEDFNLMFGELIENRNMLFKVNELRETDFDKIFEYEKKKTRIENSIYIIIERLLGIEN